MRHSAATVRTSEYFIEMEWECVNIHVVTLARNSNKNGAPVSVCQIIGQFDDAWSASCVDDDVCAASTHQLQNSVLKVRGSSLIEAVVDAPILRMLKFGIYNIYTNYWVAANHLCRLRNIQADSANAKNYNGLPNLKLGIIIYNSHCGSHGATKQWGQT